MAQKLKTLDDYINSFLQSKECPENLTERQLAELHDVYTRLLQGDFGEIVGKLNYNIRRNLFRMFREGTDYFCYYRLKWLFTKYKGNGLTLKERVLRHGKKEGLRLWNEYCKQQSETNTFEYKSKKYGMTKKEFKEYNKSRQVTLKNCIKRHGKEKGTKIFEDYRQQQIYTKSLERYIDEFGKEEGMKIFGEINAKKQVQGVNYIGASVISQEFCEMLVERLPLGKEKCYYDTNGGEYIILNEKTGRNSLYDFVCFAYNKPFCIEFHGDYWHQNPKTYNANDIMPYPGESKQAKEVWQHDQYKKELIESTGIKYYYVWESDYLENKEKCVENIIEELKKNEAI